MDNKELAKVFKALSNPNRLEIFKGIAEGSNTSFKGASNFDFANDENFTYIYEMHEMFTTIGASTISHHIKELTNAGLITTEKRGKFLVASLNRAKWDEVSKFLGGI